MAEEELKEEEEGKGGWWVGTGIDPHRNPNTGCGFTISIFPTHCSSPPLLEPKGVVVDDDDEFDIPLSLC